MFFYIFSSRKARILLCFGGGKLPQSAFWCPKGTYFTRFSKLSLTSATHRAKPCLLRGKYGLCGSKRNVFRSFRLTKLANVSAKIAPLAGLHHFPPPGLLLCPFGGPKTVVFRSFASRKTLVFDCLRGFRPSKWCFLVSQRHVFYELFELLLGCRENERDLPSFTVFFESTTTPFALFHHKFWPNVSSRIAPLAGLPPHPQIVCSSPAKFNECFG